ncbi:MAG: chromosomal replication initiator protein DnaA [Bacilli bacterium]|nr:chromosomal replication initiator protein DnaA [Bacilli bacterium]
MKTAVQEFTQLWNRILSEIKTQLNDDRIFNTFFSDTELSNVDNNTLYVIVNSRLAKQVLSSDYSEVISKVVENILESNYTVSFLLKDEVNKEIKVEENKPSYFNEFYIKKEMTFDNFVVGDSNREAHQASLIVSSLKPSKWNPNPLFLYSDSGLGKTHLLNSIGNRIKENNSLKNVVYITAAGFFAEYVKIATGNTAEQGLKEFFKNVDVLLIDDIQFFTGKKKSQEMFFDVFSEMIGNGKQVVITSDRHPNELKDIENRLVTRFAGGLPVSINPPDKGTSMEIAKMYISASGMDINRIDPEVFSFFAEKFSKNIRELKGAVNKLLFYTINIKKVDHISLSNAIEAVSDFLKANESNKKLSEIKIIDVVSNYYSLTPSQLTGNMRTSQIALARHIAMYLMRELLDISFDKIGESFGGKDHSTVMSACKNVEKGVKTNPSLESVIKELKEKLK